MAQSLTLIVCDGGDWTVTVCEMSGQTEHLSMHLRDLLGSDELLTHSLLVMEPANVEWPVNLQPG